MRDKLEKNNHSAGYYRIKKSAIIGVFLACVALVIMVPVFVSNSIYNASAADTSTSINIEEDSSSPEVSSSVISNTL